MRPSIISEPRFDDAARHTWRRPLPPIDQENTQLFSSQARKERPCIDQPPRPAVSTKYPS